MTEHQKCVLDDKKKGGCATCSPHCSHRIALQGLNGIGGRVGSSGIPLEYQGVTLTNSPARESQLALYESLSRYVKTFNLGEDVKSVYLYSDEPGTGKTTTACALLNEWITRRYLTHLKNGEKVPQQLGMFLDINEMQSEYNIATMVKDDNKLKEFGERILKAQQTPYLVIDDIGVRDATEAFRGYVHSIVNARVSNQLPTVYTSNLEIDEMEEVFDRRLFDRIRSNTGVMEFKGKSKRRHVGR